MMSALIIHAESGFISAIGTFHLVKNVKSVWKQFLREDE